MSQPHSSSSLPLSPNLPELAALADTLRDAAEALHAFCRAAPERAEHGGAGSPPSAARMPDEYRTYRVPGFALAEENRMLAEFGAEDWRDLFRIVQGRLETLSRLLLHFDDGADIDGTFLGEIAENFLVPILDAVHRLHSLVADFREPGEE